MFSLILMSLMLGMLRVACSFSETVDLRGISRVIKGRSYTRGGTVHAGIHVVDRMKCAEIRVCLNDKMITILEAIEETQEKLINIALETTSDDNSQSDPYGSVLWPAAIAVSLKLSQIQGLHGKIVLELGSGTGLVAMYAATTGAKKTIASDFNQFCLKMIRRAIDLNSIDENKIQVLQFDIKDSTTPLPGADVVVLADVLYDKKLGIAVAHRVYEALARGSCVIVIVGDSPTRLGREPFLHELRHLIRQKPPRSDINEKSVQFEWVLSETLTTYRNSIISKSNTQVPEPIKIGILCLGN